MSAQGGSIHVGSPAVSDPLEEGVAVVNYHSYAKLPSLKGEATISPPFWLVGHKWLLTLYPGGDSSSTDGMVSVYLVSAGSSKIVVKFDIMVKLAGGGNSRKITTNDPVVFTERGEGWGKTDYIRRDIVMNASNIVLRNGTLSFEVRIRPESEYFCHVAEPHTPLGESMVTLFRNEDTVDQAFVVKGQLIYSHRAVLRAQAPELAKRCERNNKANPKPIDDVEPSIFRAMMLHLYGDCIQTDEWKEKEKPILEAAGRYGFGRLKLEAESWYVKYLKLTPDNVVENLLDTKANEWPIAERAGISFIVANVNGIRLQELLNKLDRLPDVVPKITLAMSEQLSLLKKRKRV